MNYDNIKRIGKNSIFVIIGKLLYVLSSLLFIILITRFINPEEYGLLSLITTLMILANQFSSLGMDLSIYYFIKKRLNQTIDLIKKYITYRLIALFVIILLINLFSGKISEFYNNEKLTNYILIISVTLPFFGLMNSIYPIFQGLEMFKDSMKSEILFNFTKFSAILFLVLGFRIEGVLVGYGISYFITSIFSYRIIIKNTKSFNKKFNENKELINYTIITFFVIILGFCSDYIINLFLGVNPVELGLFDSSNKISIPLLMIPTALATVLTPGITLKSVDETRKIINLIFKFTIIIILPVIVMFSFAPEFLVKLLLGTNYINAKEIISFVTISLVIQGLFLLYQSIAYSKNKPKIVLYGLLIKTIIIISFNFFLINAFNASIVMLISSLVTLVVTHLLLKEYVSIPWNNIFKSIFFVIPLITALILDLNVYFKLIIVVLAFVLYALLAYKKALNAEERDLVNILVSKILKTTRNINV